MIMHENDYEAQYSAVERPPSRLCCTRILGMPVSFILHEFDVNTLVQVATGFLNTLLVEHRCEDYALLCSRIAE